MAETLACVLPSQIPRCEPAIQKQMATTGNIFSTQFTWDHRALVEKAY